MKFLVIFNYTKLIVYSWKVSSVRQGWSVVVGGVEEVKKTHQSTFCSVIHIQVSLRIFIFPAVYMTLSC